MNLYDLFNEEKVRLDPKCWTGKKIGNPKTKVKGGVRVNNCVPAESVAEGSDFFAGSKFADEEGNTFSVEKIIAFAKKIQNIFIKIFHYQK